MIHKTKVRVIQDDRIIVLKWIAFFAAVTIALLSAVQARAGDEGDAGSNAADYLRLGVGAAPAGQGEAYVARGGVIDALHYNPAGLSMVERSVVQLQHNDYIEDIKSEYIAGVMPFHDWRFGASVFLLDEGSFTRRTLTQPNGAGTFDASSSVWSFASAYQFTPRAGCGITLRYLREKIDSESRNGFSTDLGLYGKLPQHDIELGLALRNLGTRMKFDRDEEDLPLEVAGGISVPFSWGDWDASLPPRLRLSVEGAVPRNQEVDFKFGAEGWVHRYVALRAGYDSRNDLGPGYSLGLGFRYEDLEIDYAFVPFDHVGDAHRVSLTYSFGGDADENEDAVIEEETVMSEEESDITEAPADESEPGSDEELVELETEEGESEDTEPQPE